MIQESLYILLLLLRGTVDVVENVSDVQYLMTLIQTAYRHGRFYSAAAHRRSSAVRFSPDDQQIAKSPRRVVVPTTFFCFHTRVCVRAHYHDAVLKNDLPGVAVKPPTTRMYVIQVLNFYGIRSYARCAAHFLHRRRCVINPETSLPPDLYLNACAVLSDGISVRSRRYISCRYRRVPQS